MAPLERLKILFQVQDFVGGSAAATSGSAPKYQGIAQSLRRIYAEEGARGFFKGNGANCVRVFPYVAIQFAVFERAKPLLLELQNAHAPAPTTQLATGLKVLGGAVAGVTSVVVTYPLDAARARLTVQGGLSKTQYAGIWDAIRGIFRAEGLRGVYRGVLPTVWGIAPYVGLNFAVFEALRTRAPKDAEGNPDPIFLLACGGAAGACGQTAAYPMDVLRRRFQLSALRSGSDSGSSSAYSSTLGGLRSIVRGEGVRGLYKGIVPNLIKVVPSIAIMFTTNELLKRGFKQLEAARLAERGGDAADAEREHVPLRRRSTH